MVFVVSDESYVDAEGKRHREDGPAILWSNGDKMWFIHGKIHREDGPALVYLDGTRYWYLNGVLYTFEQWCNKLNKSTEERVLLKLRYG